MTLEEILKADGWSDADLAAVQPMLADPRLRASMEKQYGAVAAERDTFREKDGQWQRQLDEQWQPRVAAEEKKAQDLAREVARLKTELQIAKDYGYITPEAQAAAEAEIRRTEASGTPGFDPNNYVSMAQAKELMEAEGRAITMTADINNEYAYLHGGKTLYEYETEINGRTMRGFSALREEAKAKRMNLDQYVSDKFDFKGKREAIKAKAASDREAAIRADEGEKVRNEMASQYANPLMATAVPSRQPFFKPKEGGKQPWEVPAQQRTAGRLERAMQVQVSGKVN